MLKDSLQDPEKNDHFNSLVPETPIDRRSFIAAAIKLTDQQAFTDLDAVVAWADKQPRANTAKLGVTGMCRGGRTVWMYTAHQKKIKAGVAWYGSLMPIPPAMPQGPLDVTDKI